MKRRAFAVVGAAASILVLAAACSLDLDESLLSRSADAGESDALAEADGDVGVDAAPADAGTDTGIVDAGVDAGPVACAKDLDCSSTDACLKGTCDLARGRCVYDVCRPAACKAATCGGSTHTCGTPVSYDLLAAQFEVFATVVPRGAVAVYPWLYLATQAGVLAYDVSNPASTSPRQVPVAGVGFTPASITASGGRVWVVGQGKGTAPDTDVPLAYIDSPVDPFATLIEAHSVVAKSSRAPEEINAFGRAGESVLLVTGTSPFLAAALDAPLDASTALAFTEPDSGPPAGSVASAVSGTRLVLNTVSGGAGRFTFVEGAGTAAAAFSPTVTPDAGAVIAQRMFAQGADGTVFWAFLAGTSPRITRGAFVIPGGAAPVDENASVFDLETYVGGLPPTNVFGPEQAGAAMIDEDVAMVAMAAPEALNQTAVQFVARKPGLVKVGDKPARAVLPIAVGAVIAAAGARSVGYVVSNVKNGATVYVLDPACPPP